MIINALRLKSFVRRILEATGSSEAEAAIVADHLVEANLRGHDSHGVGMLPTYVANLRTGTLKANQRAEIVTDTGAISVWDGRCGYGQVIALEAVDWAVEAARRHGVAVNGIRNAHHVGRVGAYGERAAQAGMVSFHFVNVASGVPPVAPFGGREGRYVTNPICLAIPGTDRHKPIVLDFATSRVAMGKLRIAHHSGTQAADGALLDAQGEPTTDPAVMFSDPRGVMLPFGDHKGSGLALMCELLAGAVVGSATTATENGEDGGIRNGVLSIVIDPNRLGARCGQASSTDSILDWVKSSTALDPEAPVLVAGEPENATKARRLAEGIPIDRTTWKEVMEIARQFTVF